MEDASPALFRPTRRQTLGRGLYFGAIAAAIVTVAAMLVSPPGWAWWAAVFGPPVAGGLAGLVIGWRTGTEISAGGIRTRSVFGDGTTPWHRVVDLRAERRGGRTAVSVYLDSGASVRLHAPYSGGFLTADPRFESKMFALSYIWRSNRFGGLPR